MLRPNCLLMYTNHVNGSHFVHTFGEEKFNFGKTA